MLCGSSHEEIPHVQGKRNPSKMVGVARGLLSLTFKNSEVKRSYVLPFRDNEILVTMGCFFPKFTKVKIV